jgi:hypothetical protein
VKPEWVKARDDPKVSWHLPREGDAMLCGRVISGTLTAKYPPLDEKSCETCLRIHERNRTPDTVVDGLSF